MKNLYLIIPFILISFLSSCALISEPKESVKKFIIQSEESLPPVKKNIILSLDVICDVPNQRPYIKTLPHQIEYLAYSEWHEDLKGMIEKSILQSFQDANITTYIGTNPASQKCIKIHIRHFGLEYLSGQKLLHVAYFVELFNALEPTHSKQKLFEIKQEHLWTSDNNYIHSLNKAHNEIVKQIYQWVK